MTTVSHRKPVCAFRGTAAEFLAWLRTWWSVPDFCQHGQCDQVPTWYSKEAVPMLVAAIWVCADHVGEYL